MKVIFIMIDSLRRDHLGAYGNKSIRTPNINKLSSDKTYFHTALLLAVCDLGSIGNQSLIKFSHQA